MVATVAGDAPQVLARETPEERGRVTPLTAMMRSA
jgi:hypothetical protein